MGLIEFVIMSLMITTTGFSDAFYRDHFELMGSRKEFHFDPQIVRKQLASPLNTT